MNELRPKLGYVELWEKQKEVHWTASDSSSNYPCTTYIAPQRDVNETTTRNSDQGTAWPPNTPGAGKLKVTFSIWPTHRRTILKEWENKWIIATTWHRCVHKYRFHQPQNTNSLSDTRNDTTHMVFECELTVKLHAMDVEVGTSSNGNIKQDQVTMRRKMS